MSKNIYFIFFDLKNVFKKNLSTINLKNFSNYDGIYCFERMFNKVSGKDKALKGLHMEICDNVSLKLIQKDQVVIDIMFNYHFFILTWGLKCSMKKKGQQNKTAQNLKQGLEVPARQLILGVEENFMQNLSAFLVFC